MGKNDMSKADPAHDKVVVIVEETIQHVYLMDPDDTKTVGAVQTLQLLVSGQGLEALPIFDKPSAVLGKRAKKGPPMPGLTLREFNQHTDWRRFTGLTLLIPNENGVHVEELKFTNTTITRKPIKG